MIFDPLSRDSGSSLVGLQMKFASWLTPNKFVAIAPSKKMWFLYDNDLTLINFCEIKGKVSWLSSLLVLDDDLILVSDWFNSTLILIDAKGRWQDRWRLEVPYNQEGRIIKLCVVYKYKVAILLKEYLLIYDLESQKILSSQRLEDIHRQYPVDMIYDSRRGLFFIADLNSHTIAAYDNNLTLNRIFGIPFKSCMEGTLFTPISITLTDSRYLFVAEMLGNCVKRINIDSGLISLYSNVICQDGILMALCRPSGIHFIPRRGIIVGTHYSRTPGKIVHQIRDWSNRLNGPRGIALKGDKLLISDTYNNRVIEIDYQGQILWSTRQANIDLFWPRCSVYHKDMIGIADARNKRIVILKDYKILKVISKYKSDGAWWPFEDPHWIDFVDESTIVVADSVLNKVILLRTNGEMICALDGLSNPHSVRYYDTMFLVTDTDHDRILYLDLKLNVRYIEKLFEGKGGRVPFSKPKYCCRIKNNYLLTIESNLNRILLLKDRKAEYIYYSKPLSINGVMLPRCAEYSSGYLLVSDYFGSRIVRVIINERMRSSPWSG